MVNHEILIFYMKNGSSFPSKAYCILCNFHKLDLALDGLSPILAI